VTLAGSCCEDSLERALQGFVIGIRTDFLGGFDEPFRLLWIVRLLRFSRHSLTLSEWWKSSCSGTYNSFIARNSEATTVFQVYKIAIVRLGSFSIKFNEPARINIWVSLEANTVNFKNRTIRINRENPIYDCLWRQCRFLNYLAREREKHFAHRQ
jgi:hypothetical protein